jgi:hypothetical protein
MLPRKILLQEFGYLDKVIAKVSQGIKGREQPVSA